MDISLKKWENKVVIVTGASSGIGAVISQKLVDLGLVVAGISRSPISTEINSDKQTGKLYSFKCDVSDEDQVTETFDSIRKILGPVSVLINNAGVLSNCDILEGDTNEFRKTFETNVIAKCITTKIAVKEMKQHDIAGQIININSVLGHHVYDIPNMNVYPASQFAVTALNETLRLELIRNGSNIKVTNLSPGPVDTKMFDPEKPLKHKIKYFLKPEDVAEAVIYILSTPAHVLIQDLIIRPVGEFH